MIDLLQTLEALERHGTTSAAGTALRVSQSAVSKRIATLEAHLGYAPVERHGRGLRLTPAGQQLLTRARPLLAELRDLLREDADSAGPSILSIGVSESILSSWGADVLRQARDSLSGLRLDIHAHRSPVVIERVRSGEYALGLCAGVADSATDLWMATVGSEEMVLIPSGLQPVRWTRGLPILTIEEHAATWPAIRRAVAAAGLEVEGRIESFAAVARMALAGLGHGLVPAGTAQAAGLRREQIRTHRHHRILRPVCLVGRPRAVASQSTAHFASTLTSLAAARLADQG